jgi:hypothetical protein
MLGHSYAKDSAEIRRLDVLVQLVERAVSDLLPPPDWRLRVFQRDLEQVEGLGNCIGLWILAGGGFFGLLRRQIDGFGSFLARGISVVSDG